MEYLRNKLVRYNNGNNGNSLLEERPPHENANEKTIVIRPGQVEQATHNVRVPGKISLEELRFWKYLPDPHDYIQDQDTIDNNQNQNSRHLSGEKSAISNTNPTETPKHKRETQDSYVDIVVFEFPVHCSPTKGTINSCDLLSYGIGTMVDDNHDQHQGIPQPPRLSLCNETTGRLHIDHEVFEGYHTSLHVPPSGYLMKDRITDPQAHRIPSFPSKDTQYEIWIANCDTHVYGTGRNIELSGQILFEYDPSLAIAAESTLEGQETNNNPRYFGNDSPSHYHVATNHQEQDYGGNLLLDGASLLKLIAVGLSIFVFFSAATCRIRRGTREDYYASRQRTRLPLENDNDGDEAREYEDDNNDNDSSDSDNDSDAESGGGERVESGIEFF